MKLFFLKLFGAKASAISKAGQDVLSAFHKAIDKLEGLKLLADAQKAEHLAQIEVHKLEAEALDEVGKIHEALANKIKALVTI
jgi:hypothetical protein